MSYTNINIPSFFDKNWEYYEQKSILELKNKILSDRLLQVIKDLENIPKAIEEHGHIDIFFDNEKIRLIKKEPTE